MYKLILGLFFLLLLLLLRLLYLWEDIKSHKNRSTNYLLDIYWRNGILFEMKQQSNLHFFDSMNPPVKRERERERERNKWKWNPISRNSSNYQLRQLIYMFIQGKIDYCKRKRKEKKQNDKYISIFRSLLHCMCFILNRYIFFSRERE